jgi:hypothetical protein
VGAPDTDGSDFIGVRIGGDELFFSPAEIGLGGPRRGAPEAPQKTSPAPAQRTTRKDPAATTASNGTAATNGTAPAKNPVPAGTPVPTKKPVPAGTPVPVKNPLPARSAPPVKKAAPAKTTAKAVAPKAPAKTTAAAKGRKPPRTPAIAITVRSTDAGWSVEAHRGGKVALKPTAVRAGTVQEIADALDEDVVTGMVREVLDARRAVAESEAAELREALARAEAVLAEYESGH